MRKNAKPRVDKAFLKGMTPNTLVMLLKWKEEAYRRAQSGSARAVELTQDISTIKMFMLENKPGQKVMNLRK